MSIMNQLTAPAIVRSRVPRGRSSHVSFSLINTLAVLPDRVERCNIVVREGLVYRIGAAHAATARRFTSAWRTASRAADAVSIRTAAIERS